MIEVMLDKDAWLPTKAHEADAGWDLRAKEDFVVPGSGSAVHDTGVHMAIPKGYVGMIKSKSGLNVKSGITAEGVIDSGYTGSIVVKFYNHTGVDYKFKAGDKITQVVVMPVSIDEVKVVESLGESERGDKGFGSSGK